MQARLEIIDSHVEVSFDENMCLDLSLMPDFYKHVENIYNNHLSTCISKVTLKSIECQLTNLLYVCRERGALFLEKEHSYIRDSSTIVYLKKKPDIKFDNYFTNQLSKFKFIFGEK